ncbi:UBC-like protein, partial [Corynespora cassiicola Philippines]
ASFEGPLLSPYEGGIFHLAFVIPPRYPWKPPKFRLLTRIYHPNIDSHGKICYDISKGWEATWTVQSVVVTIAGLLDKPGVDDPLVPEILEVYMNDRPLFDENSKKYTQKYAMETNSGEELGERFSEACQELGEGSQ